MFPIGTWQLFTAAHASANVGFTLLFCRRWQYMQRYTLVMGPQREI